MPTGGGRPFGGCLVSTHKKTQPPSNSARAAQPETSEIDGLRLELCAGCDPKFSQGTKPNLNNNKQNR